MTDLATPQPVADAVTTALTAALSTIAGAQVLDYSQAAATPTLPNQYLLWSLMRRVGSDVRVSAGQGTVPWRLTVRTVARTVQGANALQACVNEALEMQRLTANGKTSTPVQPDGSVDIGPDSDGYVSGSSDWAFTF